MWCKPAPEPALWSGGEGGGVEEEGGGGVRWGGGGGGARLSWQMRCAFTP